MKLLTKTEIECCRRIGRDVANNCSTIGLPELDALCDTALRGAAPEPQPAPQATYWMVRWRDDSSYWKGVSSRGLQMWRDRSQAFRFLTARAAHSKASEWPQGKGPRPTVVVRVSPKAGR